MVILQLVWSPASRGHLDTHTHTDPPLVKTRPSETVPSILGVLVTPLWGVVIQQVCTSRKCLQHVQEKLATHCSLILLAAVRATSRACVWVLQPCHR